MQQEPKQDDLFQELSDSITPNHKNGEKLLENLAKATESDYNEKDDLELDDNYKSNLKDAHSEI